MEQFTIALFGEAEKGEYRAAYFCNQLVQLVENFGNAPFNSKGLFYAVQALLYRHNLIFIRVREEGFSTQDYYDGVKLLEKQTFFPHISAVFLPGVGNNKIIETVSELCISNQSILVISEADLYDYLLT